MSDDASALPWLQPARRLGGRAVREWGAPWSLRRKVLILLAALIVAGLGVADLVTYRTLRSTLLNREDSELAALSRGAAREILSGGNFPLSVGGSDEPGGTTPFVEARSTSGGASSFIQASAGGQVLAVPRLPRQLPPVPNADPADPAANAVYLTLPSSQSGQPPYRVRISDLIDGPVVLEGEDLIVATPLSDVDATLHALFWTEFGVSAGVLLLALLAGAWLVSLSLRPLEDMADTAGHIAAGQLDLRVPSDDTTTEVGRLGAALNEMLGRIEGAFAEKEASEARLRRFVADASHELRTPLTSIRGYAELFRRGADRRPQDLAKAMRRIEDEASRMGLLVDDLLLLARLDQGRQLESLPVDLRALVSESVEAARVVSPDRPIEEDLGPPAVVQGDRHRLRQVVDNLLGNVRVHTGPGTEAWVRLHPADGAVVLEVEDAGPGIAPDLLPKVFERFYRADPARTHAGGGAGLGLSIVESIVSAHGGRVEAVVGANGGALFRVVLPVGTPGPQPPVAPGAAADGSDGPHPAGTADGDDGQDGGDAKTQPRPSIPWASSQRSPS